VEKWLGTPYRGGGLDTSGIDCSGLTRQLYRSVAGIALPHNAAQQFLLGVSVPASALKAGDLVFFSERGRGIFHVGLVLAGDQFAHASATRGVMISSLREPYFASRFHGARRFVP
jgi:cell wall-associated NlpC family hydrolase